MRKTETQTFMCIDLYEAYPGPVNVRDGVRELFHKKTQSWMSDKVLNTPLLYAIPFHTTPSAL